MICIVYRDSFMQIRKDVVMRCIWKMSFKENNISRNEDLPSMHI